ncbi:AcrR family transcriptional regulator [Pseudomonas sp. OG7]|uniref:hypothetical protein n=1 Tax=Pseudomonas sp. OG7 TaxID=2587037 RepID=UPI00160AC6C9|nr:hypothetical protein [Pseudomonas sp. OG7]MBB3271406.1 AcrR family transcriptional regulator [Pseudomonas sp. OG7]
MSSQETRERLISIIKQHQLDNGQSKLSIIKLSDTAGISRQAFNRYYGDLKDYCTGKLSIARLLIDDSASLRELIENKDERISRLENELSAIKASHKAELEAVIDNHISTLMNNDIMAFEAGQLAATLTGQSNHNAYLNKQLTELKVQNTKLTMDLVAASSSDQTQAAEKSDKNFLAFDPDLSSASKAFIESKNFNDYEDAKHDEILKIENTIKKLPNPESIDVLFFQERYISDFKLFCSRTFPAKGRILIVVRLPLYSQEELKLLMKSLAPISSFSIYVPYSPSEAIISAKRQFNFRDIPPEELRTADSARLPLPAWGFESIHINKVKQGE